MKTLLKSTAILEGLTGLLLFIVPAIVSDLLLGQALTENSAIIVAMIAGSALMAIALVCWLVSESENTKAVIKGLVLYNFAVVLIVVFSAFQLSVYNLLFSGVAGTHFMYGIWCLLVIKK